MAKSKTARRRKAIRREKHRAEREATGVKDDRGGYLDRVAAVGYAPPAEAEGDPDGDQDGFLRYGAQ